jgi:hypothetical protein
MALVGFPQRLKPLFLQGLDGRAEALLFQKHSCTGAEIVPFRRKRIGLERPKQVRSDRRVLAAIAAFCLCLTASAVARAQDSQQQTKADDRPEFGKAPDQHHDPALDNAHPAAGPQKPKREEQIIVTQPKPGEEIDQVKARGALNAMYQALGGERWLRRGDYILKGHTSSFYKNAPTGVGDFLQFHHVLADGSFQDRIELTKKRDVVQVWTATEGVEVTYKGPKALPKEQQDEYIRRLHYSLDAIANVWLKDPDTLLIYGGTKVVARREVEEITLVDKENDSVDVDIELSTHLPLRRIFKFRNEKYKDFDEDVEEYSDYHDAANPLGGSLPVPYVTTRYFNGDMVAQRFVEEIEFKPVDPALFAPGAPIGKHKY